MEVSFQIIDILRERRFLFVASDRVILNGEKKEGKVGRGITYFRRRFYFSALIFAFLS